MQWLLDKIKNNESFTLEHFIKMEGSNFPLLYNLSATKQDSVWHEEGNVYIHTSMVLDEVFKIIDNNEIKLSLNDKVVLVLSAIFHDIGKTSTTKTVEIEGEDRVISPRHPEVGASYLQYRLDSSIEDKEIKKQVIDIVMHHHDVKKCVQGKPFESELLYITRNVSGKLLYLLEVADIKGRECPDKDMLLFELEIFRSYAEDYNCFHNTGDLDNQLKRYFNISGVDIDINSYTFIKTKYDLLNNIIEEPHVGLAKHYVTKNPSVGNILVGLSGSGKSSTAKLLYQESGMEIICPDNLRSGNKKEDRKEAYRKMLEMVKNALREKRCFTVDATNIREDARNRIHDMIEQYGGLSCIVFMETSVDACTYHDQKRNIDNQAGKDVILKQMNKFQAIKDKKYHMVI